jgi:hypothetical protein
LDWREFTVNVTGAPAMITITLELKPVGSGGLFLYREDGVVLGATSGSPTPVSVVRGTKGYFLVKPAPNQEFDRLVVNGTTYTSTKTPVITLDRDMRATAYMKGAKPEEEKKPPTEKPWYEQTYFGLPLWAWIAIGAGGAAAIGVAAYAEEERRRRLITLMAKRGAE